jgi:Peptidase family M23/Lysozyme like domain
MAMGKKGLADSLKSYSVDVQNIVSLLGQAEKSVDRIASSSGKAAGALDKVVKPSGTKAGNRLDLGSNDARFGNEAIHDRIYGSMMPWLDKINALQQAQDKANYRTGLVMGGIQAGQAIIGGVGGMMQSTAPVIQQATSYYNAAVMGGFSGPRSALESATFKAMGGGITSPGSPAAVSQYLAMQGMNVNTMQGSTYNQTLAAVGNAAKYLNMDNMAAAQAISGFTTGAGSKNLMQKLGIFTSDPRTGKERSIGSILEDVGDRLSNGRKMTVQGVNDSFRRGYLGVDLKAMGLTDDQQQLVKQYLIEKAKGNNMDLSNNAAMSSLMKKAGINNANPQDALQRINASNTNSMQVAEKSYIDGMNTAAASIEALNSAINQLTPTVGGLKSYFDTLQGSNAGSGFTQMGSKLLDTGQNLLMMRMLMGKGGAGGGFFGGGGSGKGFFGGGGFGGIFGKAGSYAAGGGFRGALRGFAKSGVGKLGITGAIIGGGMEALQGIGTSHQGASIGSGVGSTAGAIAGGALGSLIGPVGTFVGGALGGWLGGMAGGAIGGMFDGKGGGNSAPTKLSMTTSTINLVPPVKKFQQLGAGWGAKDPSLWSGSHGGLDWWCQEGTPVYASADGKIAYQEQNAELGKYVVVQHGPKLSTVYCHLSSFSGKVGQMVSQGVTVIGSSGKTGNISGAHVHLALCEAVNAQPTAAAVDPTPHLAGGFPTKWKPSGSATPTSDTTNSSTSNSTSQTGPSSAANKSVIPVSFRQSLGFADIAGGGNSSNYLSLTAGDSSGKSSSGWTSNSRQALLTAGFRGDALRTAEAVVQAASRGKSDLHKRMGGRDTYGLFQIDMGSASGENLKRAYHLANAKDALDPVMNARIAYDLSKKGTDWSWEPAYVDGSYKKYLTGRASASSGMNYVSHDQPVNVHAGEAILDANQAREYRQNKMIAEKSTRANVVVNVTVAQATEQEARRLANLIKQYLEEDTLVSNAGSM